jgi:hypothetical protein
MEYEITKKGLNFINDIDFRVMLLERLIELEKVSRVNANYSTIFLAISTLEGIFKHVANIFKADFKKSPAYVNSDGSQKDFNHLTIDDLYFFLSDLKVIPRIDNFQQVFKLFRDYRNFIHPQAQRKKDWPIDLGQAQMALGLLNATIGYLDRDIFIGKEIFQILEGNPDYDSTNKVLHLRLSNTLLHSFLVLERQILDRISLSFTLELPQRSIFNFVFSFADEGNFKMLRLDTREGRETTNSLLHCTQKYFWRQILFADEEHPPQALFPVEITIDFKTQIFSFQVDGKSYSFKDKKGNVKNLYDEIKPNMKIGFFNEEGPVKISEIGIK